MQNEASSKAVVPDQPVGYNVEVTICQFVLSNPEEEDDDLLKSGEFTDTHVECTLGMNQKNYRQLFAQKTVQ